MSIAEKLQTIAENEQRVYNAGYQKGKAEGGDSEAAYNNGFEAGKQSEYDSFWDVYQNYGNAAYYYDAFSSKRFTDENYNPKYDIICAESINSGCKVFYETEITDTKVSITAPRELVGIYEPHINEMFRGAKKLKTIRKLIVSPITNYINTFVACTALENIIIEGVIARDFKIQYSPLTRESITNVYNALSTDTSDKTVAFSLSAVNKAFETSEGLADGSTSDEWTSLIATKPNWTIALS